MSSIDGIISEQSSRAQTYTGKADGALSAAINAAGGSISGGTATISWGPTDQTAPTTTPQIIDAKYIAPTSKPSTFDRTTFQQLNAIDPLRLPSVYQIQTAGLFQEPVPTITTPGFAVAAPTVDFATINAQLNSIVVPVMNNISAPVLSNPVLPTTPSVTIPTFDKVLQANDPGALVGVPDQFVAEYTRVRPEMKAFIDAGVNTWIQQYAPGYTSGLAALEAKLQDGLNRGTALSADYENALYTRAKSRVEVDHNRAVTEIENAHRKRGFEIPPASMMSGIAQAQQATADALAIQATEVAIKRSEQEIQHIQFVMSTSAALRQTLTQAFLQYAGVLAQINQQANEHGRFYATIAVDVYKVMVERYRAQMEVYKTEAAIYETRLKASLAALDIYKLQLEGVKIGVEVDSLRVESYSKQIQAEVARIEIFTALMKSVETRAEVEKTKVEVFAEQVKAYVAQLGGEELKTKVYLAALQGDEAKLKAELAKLEAYSKQVDAEVHRVQGDVAIQGLRAENNRMLVGLYTAELEGYRTDIGASVAQFEGGVKGQIAQVEAYKANKLVELEVYRTQLEKDRLKLEKAIAQGQIDQASIMKFMDISLGSWSLAANISKDVGAMYAQVGAAALNAQGTMVSQTSTV